MITTTLFDEWLQALDDNDRTNVLASLILLAEKGPQLGRPHADTLENTTIKNLKELRIQSKGKPLRAFFAFDPTRQAVVLCAGDKTSDKQFYKRLIPLAEAEYRKHLEDIE